MAVAEIDGQTDGMDYGISLLHCDGNTVAGSEHVVLEGDVGLEQGVDLGQVGGAVKLGLDHSGGGGLAVVACPNTQVRGECALERSWQGTNCSISAGAYGTGW